MPFPLRPLFLAGVASLGCSSTNADEGAGLAGSGTLPDVSGAGAGAGSGSDPSAAGATLGAAGAAQASGGAAGTSGVGATGAGAPGAGSGSEPDGAVCAEQCVDNCAAELGVPSQGMCAGAMTCCAVPASQAGAGGAGASDAGAGGMTAGALNAGQGGGAGVGGEDMAPIYDYAATVENTSEDCEVAPLAEAGALPAIDQLPDPFLKLDGTEMTKKSEWHCRRQEIRKQAEKYVYGDKPAADVVTGSVTSDKITVHVEAMGTSIDFSADVVLPSQGQAPFPAIINVGGKGGFGGISLGESRILDQGVAIIYYDHYALGQEGAAEQSRGNPNPGKFYDIYGGTHSAGLLMAWAWGASRLIDVIQQTEDSVIDVSSLGVTGCSRNGKGAFAIGVFDERIALTIPHETSTAGVPVYRLVDILNTERTDHNYFGLNWFSNNFEPFVYANGTSNVVKLPIDTHELVAMVAPRGLLVLDNPHQTQMSAPAGHLATAAGAEVFKALGVEDHVSYHSSVADTPHCSYKSEYTDLLERNIARFLKHEDAQTGDFIVGQNGDGNLADWKPWSTPLLE